MLPRVVGDERFGRIEIRVGEDGLVSIDPILTIAVDQEQAERVIYAARNGELAFALRTERSRVEDNPGVTADDIMPEAFGGNR